MAREPERPSIVSSSRPPLFSAEQESLFREVIELLEGSGIGFAVSGAFALHEYTGIWRDTKDLDLFLPAVEVRRALALLRRAGMLRAPKIVVVTHYAPIAETIQGEPPEIFPFLGSLRLAEVIDRHQAALALHGHAHHGKLNGVTTGGVPVRNVAISLLLAHDATRPYRVFDL